MKHSQTFVHYTLGKMASKSTSFGRIATMVIKKSDDSATFANAIAEVFVAINRSARQARKTGNKVTLPPELMLNFTQNVMNQACWSARKLAITTEQVERDEAAGLAAAGHDFSAEVADEMGEDLNILRENIGTIIESDYLILSNLHNWLRTQMSYLDDVDDFHMYADRDEVPHPEIPGETVWMITDCADNWTAVESIMDNIMVKLMEDDEVNVAQVAKDAATIDFEGQVHKDPSAVPEVDVPTYEPSPPPIRQLKQDVEKPKKGFFANIFGKTA